MNVQQTLVKKHPMRAFFFIELILVRYRDYFSAPHYSSRRQDNLISDRDGWSDEELKQVIKLSWYIPEKMIQLFLQYVDSIFGTEHDKQLVYKWFFRSEYNQFNDPDSIIRGIFSIIELSSEQLQSQPDALLELINPYIDKTDSVLIHLIAKILLNLSFEYADLIIGWLLKQPESRFGCGNEYIEPKWLLSGKLIAKFSSHCSIELFTQLEDAIYYFPPLKDIEQVKWRLKATKENYYRSYWGKTQHFLLPTLDQKRISSKSKDLIEVLKRKFSLYDDSCFYNANRSTGGIVVSPLPSGNRLSNKAWRKLILQPKSAFTPYELKKIDENTVSQAGIEEFSRDLQISVSNEPVRFANLALSLPRNIHKEYINVFFYGLATSEDKQISEEYKENWEKCSIDLLEKVIHHFYDHNDEYEDSLVRLLERRADDCSEGMLNILMSLAKCSKNPEFNQLTVWDPKEGKSTESADSKRLLQTSLNSVRGIAYSGISNIFWKNESFAFQHLEIIDNAISDEHPAIRLMTIDLLMPLLNYDNDYAHNKFIELSSKDIRITVGRGINNFFNQGFNGKHQEKYLELTLRMLTSSFGNVRKMAAQQIYARWFFNDLFQAEVNLVLQGDSVLREGCASIVSQLLREDKYHDKIHKIEAAYEVLINDDEKEIQRKAISLGEENYWKKPNTGRLFELFVNSKAVKNGLFELFYYLEKCPKKLSEISGFILQLIRNITKNVSEEEISYISESSLFAILQKIYDEATEDEDDETINVCLDIWDELLQSDMLFASSIVNELDQGLLS